MIDRQRPWGPFEPCNPVTPLKPSLPAVRCFVPTSSGPAALNDVFASTPLRLARSGLQPCGDGAITFAEYFRGIEEALFEDSGGRLADAARSCLSRDVCASDISDVRVYAEKHGSDYHPAKVEVDLGEVTVAFVMNVAASQRGRDRLEKEFAVLSRLHSRYDLPYLPRVYFKASAAGEKRMPPMDMFLADWFDGYHEFHLTAGHDDAQQVVLWDAGRGNRRLSRAQAALLYEKAALILTRYYDPESFAQIFPWHHGAGDFVAKVGDEDVDVRLISARQYDAMVAASSGITQEEALLLFLLNLTIRMRLDRFDGVGEVAWADRACVDATVKGFQKGLRAKQDEGQADGGLAARFAALVESLGLQDLAERFAVLVDACDQRAPDMPIVRGRLVEHVMEVRSALLVLLG